MIRLTDTILRLLLTHYSNNSYSILVVLYFILLVMSKLFSLFAKLSLRFSSSPWVRSNTLQHPLSQKLQSHLVAKRKILTLLVMYKERSASVVISHVAHIPKVIPFGLFIDSGTQFYRELLPRPWMLYMKMWLTA